MAEKDMVISHTKALLAYFTVKDTEDYRSIYDTIKELRELSFSSDVAKNKLLKLIYSENINTKMHSAESLSFTKSFPEEVIPVFQAFLEVAREQDKVDEMDGWLRLCLGSIARYEDKAMLAEKNVWEYLYTQKNVNLILYAIEALSKIAKVSTASWTILCLMCHHEDETIRNFSKDLMKSDEFKLYMNKSDFNFLNN
ncbi:MAG: hypothetical protein GW805_08000 [Ignavibacteria bacterium]|nr:hypothetical protein [Ignavibacteria bacterium]OIO13817.1 MAG: hypothetical protein AUJ54_15465 [Ignavibacteria bacterium CG1_02_37_35]PIS45903.1 MAG: hypothetical protein COT22_02810 [Ignavibacteria bacterium CG08_land_8_20_14_0_20_37_9]PIX93378.1 MAG: hypothetical protein COZ25_10995 [Ignavibacteria bacterium CG_4_10_14_3_um_filter_37_18]PJC60449.1 MAG: hypothetical protein CO025_03135 [Ignavibacteria bacterium CG_4_9_14_0_2_um_filter_37_13]